MLFERNASLKSSNDPSGFYFHELSRDEMLAVIGGNSVQPQTTPTIVVTAITGGASGFSLSWVLTGAFNCK